MVPDGWRMVVGDDELVVEQPESLARVTLRELSGQARADAIASAMPAEFADWTDRSLSDSYAPVVDRFQFSFTGTKNGRAYVAIVEWLSWGELVVEVTTEMPGAIWASDTRVRNAAILVAGSLSPSPR